MYIKSIKIIGQKIVTIGVEESTIGITEICDKDGIPEFFSPDNTPGDICVKFDRFSTYKKRYNDFGNFCRTIAEIIEPSEIDQYPTTAEQLYPLLQPLWHTAMIDSEEDW